MTGSPAVGVPPAPVAMPVVPAGRPLRVMSILPPRERFAPAEAGAIALLVHRMASAGEVVVGSSPATAVFADVPFMPVPPVLFALGATGRYRAGVIRLVGGIRHELAEVHKRPELALALSRRFPHMPMVLVLHNDP